MEIYFVEAGWDYDGTAEVGVYPSLESAQRAYWERVNASRDWKNSYDYVAVVTDRGGFRLFDDAGDHVDDVWSR